MPVYLDYNGTAPVRPEAIEKMREILAVPANPSSAHSFGRAAKKYLEDARSIVAEHINAFTDEIIFTGTGTEANITVLNGFPGRRVLISAVEHSSVLKARDDVTRIPVTADGIVDLAALEKLLATDKQPALMSVMLAGNETGILQPIADIAAICKKYDALLHTDAVQALGKIPVDFGKLGCDMLTIAGHKSGGPVGAAALVVRRKLPFQPLLKGGEQEMNRRAGTSNVAAIAGFAKAIELFDLNHMKKLRGWMDGMEKEMAANGATVFGKKAPRLPNTTRVAMPGVTNETQLIDFDLKGFSISAGAACSSGRMEASHVLVAMGVAEDLAKCAIRVSGGWGTTEKEIRDFTAAWKQTCARLAQKQDVA